MTMTKLERNNLIKEIHEKGLLSQLYQEIIEAERKSLVEAGNVKLKQKIVIEDENGKETWSAIAYQDGGTVFLLDKEYALKSRFGDTNNYINSKARIIATTCKPVVRLLKKYGGNAFNPLEIDLFSHDGLRDYGVCKGDLTGIMPYDMYRNNRENIDPRYMYLSTPSSISSNSDSNCILYVESNGNVDYYWCNYDGPVCPFCIIKSDVLVSLAEE